MAEPTPHLAALRLTGEARLLVKRIAVSVIAIPLLIGLLFLGEPVFALAIAFVSLMCLIEFYRLFREIEINAVVPLGLAAGVGAPIVAWVWGPAGLIALLSLLVVAVLIWRLAAGSGIIAVGITVSGVIYIGLLLSHLVLIYKLDDGKLLVLFTFVATWIADTAAYGVGRIAGKRPLAANISPNKTIEGLAGAILINLIIFAAIPWMPLPLWARILFAVVITAAATGGDLVESALKREAGVKDSGTLIPGHGGFLDRFDSMIFTAAASYYLLILMTA